LLAGHAGQPPGVGGQSTTYVSAAPLSTRTPLPVPSLTLTVRLVPWLIAAMTSCSRTQAQGLLAGDFFAVDTIS